MKLKLLSFPTSGKTVLMLFIALFLGRSVIAQNNFTLTGKITDGETALADVSVVIQETQQGTTTNSDGAFTLSVSTGQTLVISHTGFETQTIKIGNQNQLTIVLNASAGNVLDDVVIVGYGTQRKTSLTAAVSTMKGKDIASVPVANLSNGLGGRVSGVIVKQGSGEPGYDGSNIYIRGLSSTGASQPLLIVDGIPRSFQHLDPNAIETFTVLKDAAAVAPYGVAGANGVILVTTKKGKTGAPSLTYNGYVGFQNPVVLPDFVNSYQYATLRNAAAANEGLPAAYTAEELQKFQDGSDPDAYPTHKDIWETITNKNALITQHNIDVSGGSERIQ